MANFRVVVSDPKSGKSYQVEVKDPGANRFLGRHIGDTVDGEVLGMPGYSVKITGGSDREGFPMRADLPGTRRKRILVTEGTGYNPIVAGIRRRKSLHGREISSDIGQINVKITEAGSKPVEELIKSAPKAETK
ncbi:MAG: 30S ribosomal protein S6e [Methanotrichaceae archaeon]